jgi:hypothetical protein
MPLNGTNSTDNSNLNSRNYSVLQTIAASKFIFSFKIQIYFLENLLENDDNLSYFPSINNPNHLNRSQQIFLNGPPNNTNNGLFNDILSTSNNNNNNNNPISTLSTNTFVNTRQQQLFKPLSTLTFPQQQQTRNDENVFHNNHPHTNSVQKEEFFP